MKHANNKSPGFPDLVHMKVAVASGEAGKKRKWKDENGGQPKPSAALYKNMSDSSNKPL